MIPQVARAEVTLALRDDHVRLSLLLDAVLAALRGADSGRAAEAWTRFDAALREHIEVEEQEAFAFLERSYPDQIAMLALEHTRLLALLDELSGEFVLAGSPRTRIIADLAVQLRAHTEHEEQLLQQYSSAFAPGAQLVSL